jgi:XRE family transcriptional regulator, aerobic/anaerobic benzoate catabolism transcriptional regulator
MAKVYDSASAQAGRGPGNLVLERLAERVRTIRSGRGMSRRVLARQAGVSQRHLAQLEAGRGNVSILLLSRVAEALAVPLGDLIDDRERAPEAALLEELLRQLSAPQRAEARDLLLARFGPTGELRRHRIALIGLRGAGKSTLGSLLAHRLRLAFIELDREIEAMNGMALAQMFDMFGQEKVRRSERAALDAVLQRHGAFVLATGGGLVTERSTFERLRVSCLTVWVRADPKAHMSRVIAQGDLRPMADGARAMDDLVAILSAREPFYAKADATLDTAGKTVEESVEELERLVGRVE